MALTQTELIRKTIQLARESFEAGGSPFGALVVREGEIVAAASNQVIHTNDPTAHAEVLAIRQAAATLGRRHLNDCVLYSSSEPCPMCLGACYWARIPTVFYAASIGDGAQIGLTDEWIYDQMRLPPRNRAIQLHQLQAAAAEARLILQKYAPLG